MGCLSPFEGVHTMAKKIIISLLCASIVACVVLGCFMALYFLLPSQKARASISLPKQVEDPETTEESKTAATTEEKNTDTYVADVHQSLTLRSQPDSNSSEVASLPPMTHMQVLEFVDGTNFAQVEVSSGESKGLTGYVNSEYITKLGEPTIRVNSEE